MHTIQKLFDHMDWANLRLLEALRVATPAEASKAAILFRHVLQAESIWLTRLQGQSSKGIAVWVHEADMDTCEELTKVNREGFQALLGALSEDALDLPVEYASQNGTPHRTSTRDILIHIALHGQYHRGQINAMLRTVGLEPVPMDYILYSQIAPQ
ncbi:DinB family protein [Paenibacillus massiliensis]|uniref:DinB family protein n=1 Tax=Paenibacillus massiliensis TaxID=225917 RepID=UPI000472B094|nr:DinB family protein [Paenibacillus massiliensis]